MESCPQYNRRMVLVSYPERVIQGGIEGLEHDGVGQGVIGMGGASMPGTHGKAGRCSLARRTV
jgi:hypothetical protein